jgi:hypothetical protein
LPILHSPLPLFLVNTQNTPHTHTLPPTRVMSTSPPNPTDEMVSQRRWVLLGITAVSVGLVIALVFLGLDVWVLNRTLHTPAAAATPTIPTPVPTPTTAPTPTSVPTPVPVPPPSMRRPDAGIYCTWPAVYWMNYDAGCSVVTNLTKCQTARSVPNQTCTLQVLSGISPNYR